MARPGARRGTWRTRRRARGRPDRGVEAASPGGCTSRRAPPGPGGARRAPSRRAARRRTRPPLPTRPRRRPRYSRSPPPRSPTSRTPRSRPTPPAAIASTSSACSACRSATPTRTGGPPAAGLARHDARVDRPHAARGLAFAAPAARDAGRDRHRRGGPPRRRRAVGRGTGGHRVARRRVRPLTALRPARRGGRPCPRGAVLVRLDGCSSPAILDVAAREGRGRARRRLQDQPARRADASGGGRDGLRGPAARVRRRRAARRGASGGRGYALPRGAGGAGGQRASPRRICPRSRPSCGRTRRGIAAQEFRVAAAPDRELCRGCPGRGGCAVAGRGHAAAGGPGRRGAADPVGSTAPDALF